MDTWSPKAVKRECGSAPSLDGAKHTSERKMCRVSCDKKTESEKHSETTDKPECENLNAKLDKINKLEDNDLKSQTRDRGRSCTSKTREKTLSSKKPRPSLLEISKRKSRSENVFGQSKKIFGACRANKVRQNFYKSHRSRSPQCSLRDQTDFFRGTDFQLSNLDIRRRRFRSTSTEFFVQDQDFVASSIHVGNVDTEMQGFGSRTRRQLSPRRSFGSNEDLLYGDLDRGRSTRDNDYATCGDFEYDKRRLISNYEPGHVLDGLKRTRWMNRAEDSYHFENERLWRIEDSLRRYPTEGIGAYHREMVPNAEMNSIFRDTNCLKSPAPCRATSYQRHRQEMDYDCSSRQPARNRLGWNKPEYKSSAYDDDGLDNCYSIVNDKEGTGHNARNRFDRFKSTVDIRSGRVNAIWRRRGRGYGFHQVKRINFRYGKRCNREGELPNRTSIAAEAERHSSSDPGLECMVSESLSKFRWTAEFSGPESSDDASVIRNAEKISSRIESQNRLEGPLLFRSGCFKVTKRLKPDSEKFQKVEYDHRKTIKSTSLPQSQSQIVCGIRCSEKNGAQETSELETESIRSKYSPADKNSIRTQMSEATTQGHKTNESLSNANLKEKGNSKSAKGLVGPHTPTYEENCKPSQGLSVDVDFQVNHQKPASADHTSEDFHVVSSADCAPHVIWPVYTPVSHVAGFTCNVSSVCVTSGTSWSVLQPKSSILESTSHHLPVAVPSWNQSTASVQQTNNSILQTVFRSDWPTAADQQRPLLSSAVRAGLSTATSDAHDSSLNVALVTVGATCAKEGFNSTYLPQKSYSNSLSADAFTMQLTSFPNPNSIVQYSDEGVYGDSPLLDEPVYNSPLIASDFMLGSSFGVPASRSSLDPRSARGACVPARPCSSNANSNFTRQDCDTSEGSGETPQTAHCKQEKVDRMERIAEEVKAALKPFFVGGQIDKEEYKDIMRRAVPKINASKNAGIDSKRICTFVAEYVGKVRTAQKRVVADRTQIIDNCNSF